MRDRSSILAPALFLALSLALIAAAFPLVSAGDAGPEPPGLEPVTLFIAPDLHYLSPSLTDGGAYFRSVTENADGKMTAYSAGLLEALVRKAEAERPDALILPGDLTFNGEEASHRELAAALQRVEAAGVSVYVLPGNHDLDNPLAAVFSGGGSEPAGSMSADGFREIYSAFGYDGSTARDGVSLSYCAQIAPGLRLLMIDANSGLSSGSVPDSTLVWAARQLRDAAESGEWAVAVSHQSLIGHNSLLTDGYVMGGAGGLLALYEDSNVICSLSGHIHMQHIARSEAGFYDIATSSLAVSPNQIGVLRLSGYTAEYSAEPLDVSAWARESGSDDPALLDFSAASREFFIESSRRQALAELGDDKDAGELADFFAEVNAAYFAGRMDPAVWDARLFGMWRERGGFIAAYLGSIADGGFSDHTSARFEFGGEAHDAP